MWAPLEADGFAYSILLGECVRADDDVGWRDAASVLTLLARRLGCAPDSHRHSFATFPPRPSSAKTAAAAAAAGPKVGAKAGGKAADAAGGASALIEFERRARTFLTPGGVRALDAVRTNDLAMESRRRKQQQQLQQ